MTSPTGWERSDAVDPEIVEPGAAEPQPVDAEVVEPEVVTDEPTQPDPADTVDAELVEPAPVDPVTQELAAKLALGDAAPEAPRAAEFDVENVSATPPAPAGPPVSQPGGSWLDLPPMPDIPGLPPVAPTPAGQGFATHPGQPAPGAAAAGYPQPQPQQFTQPSFGTEYPQQLAGQSYGHGAQAPTAYPPPPYQQQYPSAAPGQAGYAPYGTPAGAAPGYGLQPYAAQFGGTDTAMASMAHWLPILVGMFTGAFGFVAPLIIMHTKGQSDPVVRANAVESLNFQLTMLLAMLASAVLAIIFIGVIGLVVFPILALIFQILGAIAASRGEVYRYPFRIPFVK